METVTVKKQIEKLCSGKRPGYFSVDAEPEGQMVRVTKWVLRVLTDP